MWTSFSGFIVPGFMFNGKRKPLTLLNFNKHPKSQSHWTKLGNVHVPEPITVFRGMGNGPDLNSLALASELN